MESASTWSFKTNPEMLLVLHADILLTEAQKSNTEPDNQHFVELPLHGPIHHLGLFFLERPPFGVVITTYPHCTNSKKKGQMHVSGVLNTCVAFLEDEGPLKLESASMVNSGTAWLLLTLK